MFEPCSQEVLSARHNHFGENCTYSALFMSSAAFTVAFTTWSYSLSSVLVYRSRHGCENVMCSIITCCKIVWTRLLTRKRHFYWHTLDFGHLRTEVEHTNLIYPHSWSCLVEKRPLGLLFRGLCVRYQKRVYRGQCGRVFKATILFCDRKIWLLLWWWVLENEDMIENTRQIYVCHHTSAGSVAKLSFFFTTCVCPVFWSACLVDLKLLYNFMIIEISIIACSYFLLTRRVLNLIFNACVIIDS